ncbi:MAG: MFS transporter, partial [Candidatus Baldrarchaeia archaeon]
MKDNEGIFPLYIGLALDSLAWSILWIFTPLHVFLLGGSLFIIGVICALPPFASVVTTPIWGHLSDKTGVRKPFIILGTATSGLLALLYAILTEPFHFLVLTLAIIPF